MATILTQMFRHNTWANDRLFAACEGLDDAALSAEATGAFGSVRDTLVHIVGAEERYVSLLTGEPMEALPREGDPFPGVAALRERAGRSGRALEAAAATTPDDRVLRGVRRGEPYALPAAMVLLQAINHATEHRAQVAAILTQQGITPPEMDGWTWLDDPAGYGPF